MKEISAQEAFDRMQESPDAIYLDVRSVPEFEQGHPLRAMNIPLMHLMPGMGMAPNADFAAVVRTNVPQDAEILVGCKTGARSARACEILQELGYTNIVNVRSGFVGAIDPFGRVLEPGWSLLKLPLCSECEDNSRYEDLASRSKK